LLLINTTGEKMKSVILMLCMLFIQSGCASYLVYRGSEKKVEQRAIRAAELNGGGVGIGIDISSLDVLSERPFLQLGAAVLDVGSVLLIKEGVDSMNKDEDTNKNSNGSASIDLRNSNNNEIQVISGTNSNSGNTDNSSATGTTSGK
jgi:hypothetical protein